MKADLLVQDPPSQVLKKKLAVRSNSSLSKGSRLSSKYHNVFLFDYPGAEIRKCLDRLAVQAELYRAGIASIQRRMRVRALMVASLTLNATAVWTAKLLMQGKFSMRTQRAFFRKRWRQDPKDWGPTAKSCFARALCGYSVGADGVCVDRHLERMDILPKDAADQWKDWFRLYESMYGPGETVLCVRWHIEILDWIAVQAERPISWK